MEETATAGANTSQQQADINQNWRANRQNTTGGSKRPPRTTNPRTTNAPGSQGRTGESQPASAAADTRSTATHPPAGESHERAKRPNRPRKPRGAATPKDSTPGTDSAAPSPHPGGSASAEGGTRPPRSRPQRRNPPSGSNSPASADVNPVSSDGPSKPAGVKGKNPRGARFRSRLTEPSDVAPGQDNAAAPTPQERYRRPKAQEPVPDDLTSTLIHALRTPPYPDCPICFSSIHPSQPVWSCSPSIPVITIGPDVAAQYCWTTFHMKCIRAWAGKSVREVQDAWRARGEERGGEWRCPGCQGKREGVPNDYWCFCGAMPEPKPPRLATPHSCGNPCARVRESGCGHACPLTCHPGPCPPCQVTTQLHCYCPRQKPLMIRCGVDQGQGRDLSCGEPCQRMLACGKHKCEKPCHKGPCDSCAVVDQAKCWCGKVEKEVGCGVGEEVVSMTINPNGQEERWSGRFSCDNICDRPFDCAIHHCRLSCHTPSITPSVCPSSPSKITHCPCGRQPISPPRTSCTSPIPTCPAPCSKVLPACGHACPAKCHTGPCPPCTVPMVRPCRCGASTRSIACFELYVQGEGDGAHEEREILCERPCMALRACGKHECRRLCCPLAALGTGVAKKARRRGVGTSGEEEGPGGLHECDLVCGKTLGCGNHKCEERDHKGPCPPCLRSSFEELICACGQTVLEPPVPCGTRIACNYPCQREPPCGHPRTPHTCHGDDVPCPPCPSLTTRPCACGKKTVGNVKCSLTADKISCGGACGKLLACGFHHCEKLCHSGDCGACALPCGKARKLCLPNTHPCTHPCHAPSACPEDTPCAASVTLTCPCGRLTQTARCGRSTVHPTRTHPALKCGPECRVAQRNARLAEALGISDDAAKGKGVVYPEEVMGFARVNARFLSVVERAFKEFVEGEKRTQVLPHMPPERRKFVHDLASVYRMDTQMVDQEPHRSVQLIRRIDTRVPTPLLSTHIASSAPPPSLGKLADLKSGAWRVGASGSPPPASSSSLSANATSSTSGAGRGRGTVWGAAGAGVSRPTTPVGSTPAPVVKAPQAQRLGPGTPARGGTRTPTPSVGEGTTVQEGPVADNWEDDV